MAGIQISVLPRQKIAIPNVTNSYNFPMLAQYIDSLGWVSGTLIVSLYENEFTNTGGSPKLNIGVVNMMISSLDPSVFLTPVEHLAAISIEPPGAGQFEPKVYTARIPTPSDGNPYPAIGRYLGASLNVSANGASATGGSVTLAIDLIGRDA